MNWQPEWENFWGCGREIYHASAPGRLDVMGGIADYSGSYVLQMPIANRTQVYLSLRNDGVLRAHSCTAKQAGLQDTVEMRFGDFFSGGQLCEESSIRQIFSRDAKTSWVAYIFGCVLCLMKEKNVPCQGADFWVDTQVPIGKGVSSSAALEVATMSALCEALNLTLAGNDLPILAQTVENRIVGAPCGLMDQLATYFGKEGQLLPILCRPDHVYESIEIAKEIQFVGVDSGERHSVGGSSYTDVRTAAFMGYSIIASRLGLQPEDAWRIKTTGQRLDIPFEGYLTQISPSRFESCFEKWLPNEMSGIEFQQKFQHTIDPITTPCDDCFYAVKACTAHPIYENHRVREFSLLLQFLQNTEIRKEIREDTYIQAGELMYQSHWSYSRCGLGSQATDELVQRAYETGTPGGIYGAKITGGGAGGTVCFFCVGERGQQSVRRIASRHAEKHGCELTLFDGSSHGGFWSSVKQLRS